MRGSSRQAARETDDNVLREDLWAAQWEDWEEVNRIGVYSTD